MKAEKTRLASGLDIGFERTRGVKDAFRMLHSMLITRKRLVMRAVISAPYIFDIVSRALHGLTHSDLDTIP